MTAVIADTHSIIWYIFDSNRLSQNAILAFEQAVNNNSPIYISAISLVEMIFLTEKGRIDMTVIPRVINAIEDVNVNIYLTSLDQEISLTMQQIPRQLVPEMPDRIIAATALYLQLPLITRDLKIQALSNIQTIW